MPLAVTLRSIVEANRWGWPLEFYVLDGGVSENTRQRIEDSLPEGSAVTQWVRVDVTRFSGLSGFETCGYISKTAYARFLIPFVLPEGVRRVLYLDTDIIVTGDLRPLWEMDLNGATLGAVEDTNFNEAIRRGKLTVDQVPRVPAYFNSGVLLIDLDRWRERQVSERALQYIADHPQLLYPDQDALNAVCDGEWLKLDAQWNFQDHLRISIADMAPEQRPAIVHFVTKVKPWVATFSSRNAGFYDSYRSRTCFARTPRERISDGVLRIWTDLKKSLRSNSSIRQAVEAIKRFRSRGEVAAG